MGLQQKIEPTITKIYDLGGDKVKHKHFHKYDNYQLLKMDSSAPWCIYVYVNNPFYFVIVISEQHSEDLHDVLKDTNPGYEGCKLIFNVINW